MQVVLSTVGRDRTVGLESLSDWLRLDPDLRGHVAWDHGAANSTHLGDATQALVVAAGSSGALTALATSLKAWFAQPRRPSVKVRIRGADGRVVEIDAQADSEQISELIALLPESLRGDEQDSAQ